MPMMHHSMYISIITVYRIQYISVFWDEKFSRGVPRESVGGIFGISKSNMAAGGVARSVSIFCGIKTNSHPAQWLSLYFVQTITQYQNW